MLWLKNCGISFEWIFSNVIENIVLKNVKNVGVDFFKLFVIIVLIVVIIALRKNKIEKRIENIREELNII